MATAACESVSLAFMGRIVVEGLARYELAGLLGVSRHAIWRWEVGVRGVPGWAAVKIAELQAARGEQRFYREVSNVPKFRRRVGGGKPRKSN
jgi:DNA-binding XRE family transcriptional regulator